MATASDTLYCGFPGGRPVWPWGSWESRAAETAAVVVKKPGGLASQPRRGGVLDRKGRSQPALNTLGVRAKKVGGEA